MLDLLVRQARLPDHEAGRPPLDIGVRDGRIVALESGLAADCETLDAGGRLVTPGLIETHIHLDKSRILDRAAPAPGRGRDHMARVAAVKPGFTVEDVEARAARTLESCLLHGTMHMRSHVEVDPNIGLRGFEGVQRLVDAYRWAIDLELCVFVQEGWTTSPQADANVVHALENGAAVVGGAPGYDIDHAGQIRRIFDLARRYDVDVDIHLDVGHTTDDMDIWLVCDLTERHGWGGRVTVGHGVKYSCLAPEPLAALGRRMAEAGVALTVLPATDLFISGRHQDHSVMRGVADADALAAHGVACSLSTNNVLNPFTPFGDGSLTRIANLYANTAQRGAAGELADCFDMLTRRSAQILRRDGYGIAVGNDADLVLWDAASPAEAIACVAAPLAAFKRGRRTVTRPLPELHRPA